ncbi:hypothetical protein EYB33_00020 (plasmid) [Lysinibacillus sphaericus]|uniref:hypothetical protein n=1 Tax=Lysinibacillus sphaericus TaxID=1421 RepID=UPI001E59071A|nr:hypothetical protein [Lysinibacillus sphaericus]UDK94794.1 hypothetical protein EYB33_00020 [Lysinibacillus sphaericus]
MGELSLIIMPPQETINENRKKIGQMNLMIEKQQRLSNEMKLQANQLPTPPTERAEMPKGPLSPQAISEIIEVEKLSTSCSS